MGCMLEGAGRRCGVFGRLISAGAFSGLFLFGLLYQG